MPYGLDAHVLTVDANVLHKVDTGNLDNLFSMWAVFNKCADSVDQGRRLENLSWRLWQREQFCCEDEKCPEDAAPVAAPSPVRSIIHSSSGRIQDDVPRLSCSVDSAVDEEAVELSSVSEPFDISRPMIRRQDSSASSRSRRERHITADNFEKMVSSIINSKEPLAAAPSKPARPAVSQLTQTPVALATPVPAPAVSPTSTATVMNASSSSSSKNTSYSSIDLSCPHITARTQIVHGFSPATRGRLTASPPAPVPAPAPGRVSGAITEMPAPDAAPAAQDVASGRATKFALGGSCSSSEPDSVRPSSRPGSLLSAMRKKQACFGSQVVMQTYMDEAAIDSDSEDDDDLDESAIEDDESSEWEDSVEESAKSSMDENIFKRDNSKVRLTSRPSLITLMMNNNERARGLATQSTPALHRMRSHSSRAGPSGADEAAGPAAQQDGCPSALGPISETSRTRAQPISVRHRDFATAAICLSPRTTRTNMVQSELTASLRVGIVHARKQNTPVLQRRHTSHNVATLRQFPERACMKDDDVDSVSISKYLDASNGYYDRGW